MARQGENIYKRKDGRYEGRYEKERRADGSIKFGSVYAHSLKEVRQKLAAAKEAVRPTTDTAGCGLGEFITRWLEETAQKRVKPSSYSRYYDRVHTYIVPLLGSIPLASFTSEDAKEFIDELRGRGLSRSTVESIFATLRKALKDAEESSLIARNPCAGVSVPKNDSGANTRVLTLQEQMLLVMAAEHAGQGVELSVLLSLYAGLSTGEICALRWRDVDMNYGTLLVGNVLQRVKMFDEEGSKTEIVESPHRGRRAQRRIPLPRGITVKLREYGAGMPDDFYIISGSAKPVEPRRLRAWLDKAEEEAGLEITYQVLRRTYAAQCMENNCTEEILSQLLGHTNSRITRQMQSYSVLEHSREIAESVWAARQGENAAGKFSIESNVKTSG